MLEKSNQIYLKSTGRWTWCSIFIKFCWPIRIIIFYNQFYHNLTRCALDKFPYHVRAYRIILGYCWRLELTTLVISYTVSILLFQLKNEHNCPHENLEVTGTPPAMLDESRNVRTFEIHVCEKDRQTTFSRSENTLAVEFFFRLVTLSWVHKYVYPCTALPVEWC